MAQKLKNSTFTAKNYTQLLFEKSQALKEKTGNCPFFFIAGNDFCGDYLTKQQTHNKQTPIHHLW